MNNFSGNKADRGGADDIFWTNYKTIAPKGIDISSGATGIKLFLDGYDNKYLSYTNSADFVDVTQNIVKEVQKTDSDVKVTFTSGIPMFFSF